MLRRTKELHLAKIITKQIALPKIIWNFWRPILLLKIKLLKAYYYHLPKIPSEFMSQKISIKDLCHNENKFEK